MIKKDLVIIQKLKYSYPQTSFHKLCNEAIPIFENGNIKVKELIHENCDII